MIAYVDPNVPLLVPGECDACGEFVDVWNDTDRCVRCEAIARAAARCA